MSSYLRLKQHINTDWTNNEFFNDVQTLIIENENLKKSYTALKSCQYIAGVFDVDLLALKITELMKESEDLQRILETNNNADALKVIEEIKKTKIVVE